MTGSRIEGRACVVTGASSGIGRAIVVALARAGASVSAVARRRDELGVTARRARAEGGADVSVYQTDLVVDDEVRTLADALQARREGVDALIHSAGAFGMGRIETTPVEELDRQYAANVRGPYVLTQALLPSLRAANGDVVFVNSSVVRTPRAEVGHFAATQHALKALADALREEVNAEGIRVLSVFPGRTATERQARIHAGEGRPYLPERLLQVEDIASVVLSALSLPRSAEVTDLHVRPLHKP